MAQQSNFPDLELSTLEGIATILLKNKDMVFSNREQKHMPTVCSVLRAVEHEGWKYKYYMRPSLVNGMENSMRRQLKLSSSGDTKH